MRQALSIWCVTGVIAVTGALAPALATSEYVYKPGEFVVIDDGRAPNRQFALAAHGSGDDGSGDDGSGDYGGIGFRVYLMAEPARRFMTFSAAAVGSLGSGGSVRIVAIKPSAFD